MLESGFWLLGAGVAALVVILYLIALRGLADAPARISRSAVAGTLLAVGWLGLTWLVAEAGLLARFERRPPPVVFMLVAVVLAAGWLGLGPVGRTLERGLPLWVVVASQSFRLPLEWLMHRAAAEGVMPVQMSYSGWNFDVLTGVSSIPVAWLLARRPGGRRLALVWNAAGSLLLANILIIAVISMPMIAAFGAERLNTWVAHPPFVWLPTVMVVWALAGHIIVWRKLARA